MSDRATSDIAAAEPPFGSGAWLDAFAHAGFAVERERAWLPSAERGGGPEALEVLVAPDAIAFALVVDEATDAVYLLPPDPGTERADLGVARFSLNEPVERGVIGLAARVLLNGPGRKVVNVITGKAARAAATIWERHARPERARWFRPRDGRGPAPALAAEDWARLGTGRSLLWLHGPFVSAHTGFAGLDDELWRALDDRYDGRVWAYDHHTISKGPRNNAHDLLLLLGDAGVGPLEVDVVAHSRGGLVARDLAERARDRRLVVRSLFLAGTPNLGTPLADAKGLLGAVNRFTNLLALAPDPLTDITDAVVAVVTHVLGEAYGELPGITAMAPPTQNPSYLGELNALAPAEGVRYRVVGGVYEPAADHGSRIGRAFTNWAVDSVLHDTANDLVVPVKSALGGDRVPLGEAVTLAGVHHVGFWRSAELAAQVSDWLGAAPIRASGAPDPPPPPAPAGTSTEAAATAPTATAPAGPAAPPPARPHRADPKPPVLVPAPPASPSTPVEGATPPADSTPPPVVPSSPVGATAATASAAGAPSPGEAPPATQALTVGLRHASLEHAPYPLLVGHFAGAPMSGSEARLDDRLGGRLSRLVLLGQYPRAVGESMLLFPVDGSTPPGVVILGLGPTGELTGTELTAIVTGGLLRLASYHLEVRLAGSAATAGVGALPAPAADGDGPLSLGVSAVPIGTSWGGGLTVEGCVRAILAGVTAANERLRRLRVNHHDELVPATTLVRFDQLEMIERYADRVDLLADALDRLGEQMRKEAADGTPATVTFVPEPIIGEGASNANPPVDGGEEVWRRVGITALPDGERVDGELAASSSPSSRLVLQFTSMGRLARAERLVSEIEPTVVQPLLDSAISRHADPHVSGTLFELLIPHTLKGELNDGENLHLLVDHTTAVYPWELLSARPDDTNPQVPLALRVGVLRQFQESQDLRHDIRRASSDSILVVGNPPPGPGLAPLPGAMAEAQAVVELFAAPGRPWAVESLVWGVDGERVPVAARTYDEEPGEEVLHRLLNGEWRIVHVAAHGRVTDDEATTGVVMGGVFHLTAKVLSSLSVVPDVVFLNACHIGKIPDAPLTGMNRVAASVAESLLRIGTRAVIAAGWAVNDRAAKAFATQLYSDLLEGEHLGNAVFEARLEAKRVAKESLTWGAYQCYGDPGFRLVARQPRSRSRPALTASELRARIQRLAAAASDQGRAADPDPTATKANLDAGLEEMRVQAEALGSWGALADLAEVHAELGRLGAAAELYQQALNRGGRDVPVRAIEQLGNMLIRQAQRRVRTGEATFEEVRPQVEAAELWLRRALALGATAERLALVGSFHKRTATLTRDAERADHLRWAVQGYAAAQRLSDGSYQRNNWIQLYYLLGLLDITSPLAWVHDWGVTATLDGTDVDGVPGLSLSSPLGTGKVKKPRMEDLRWHRFQSGDSLITVGLVTGALRVRRLIDTYTQAFRLRSSERERASVVDHIKDLAALVPTGHTLQAELQDSIDALDSWQPEVR